MSLDLGWGREVFALAMALQNLILGAAAPFVGAIADKFGTGRTVAGGGLIYVVGLCLMATTATPFGLYLSAGVLIGLGLGGMGFGVVLAAVGRAVSAERRSAALGITTALGSLGSFLLPPIGQALLDAYGWSTTLLFMAAIMLATVFAALGVRGRAAPARRTIARRSARLWSRRAGIAAFCSWSPGSSSAAGTSPSLPCICRPTWPTVASRARSRLGASP
jgi:MFS family permease